MPASSPLRRRRCLLALLAALPLARASSPAIAQVGVYPSRPVRLIVPSAPAGAGDALARETSRRLGEVLGVSIVVDNRPGAAGIVGTEAAAHAAADGYTLLFATSATHLIAAAVAESTRYDPVADFDAVANLGYATSLIMVRTSLPVHTLADLVDFARANPGRVAYASSGAGSANHLDTEVLSALTGMSLLHVPYRGTADGYRALITGEVQVMIGALGPALPHVRAGAVRPLAVMAEARSPLLPFVPTLVEAGAGAADVRKWMGVVAPAGTPAPIVGRLNAGVRQVLAAPSMREWMRAQGFEVAGGSPDDFARTLATDARKWNAIVGRVVRDAR